MADLYWWHNGPAGSDNETEILALLTAVPLYTNLLPVRAAAGSCEAFLHNQTAVATVPIGRVNLAE